MLVSIKLYKLTEDLVDHSSWMYMGWMFLGKILENSYKFEKKYPYPLPLPHQCIFIFDNSKTLDTGNM